MNRGFDGYNSLTFYVECYVALAFKEGIGITGRDIKAEPLLDISNKPITQKTIAQRLGVSQRLISYALNGTGTISTEMRSRVIEEAKQLGYTPNKAARALVTGRSHFVALQMPCVASTYGMRVLSALQKITEETDYDLVIMGDYAKSIAQWPVDAVLVLDLVPGKQTEDLGNSRIPIMSMGCYEHMVSENQDYAGIDLFAASHHMLEHLYEVGCRNIVHVALHTLLGEEDPRFIVYQKFMDDHGLEAQYINVPGSHLIRSSTRTSIHEYIEEHGVPDAFCCLNDDAAIGVCRALRDKNIRVPEDVCVTGCDGIVDAADHDPPISTTELPLEEMCQAAWDTLMLRLANPQLPVQRTHLAPKRVIRESSQKT